MSQFNLFEGLSSNLLGYTRSWASIPGDIITVILPMIVLGLSITIIWHGYNIVRGAGGQHHLLDVFFRSIRTFLVVSLALTAGAYASNVIALFTELREWLTGLFAGEGNSYAALDHTVAITIDSYKRIQDYSLQNIDVGVVGNSDFSGLLTLLEGLVILFVVLLYCVVAAINLLIIDVALALVFAVGPLFVTCLAFSATASFFNNWLSTTLKYVMTAVFIAAVIGFATAIVQRLSASLSGDPAAMDLISMTASALGGGIMLIILAGKAASLGSEVVGSVALEIASLAKGLQLSGGAGKTIAGGGASAASGAGRVVGYGAGHVAGKAGNWVSGTQAGSAVKSAAQTSSAMKYALMGLNAASRTAGGVRTAMSHRSVISAMQAGAQRRHATRPTDTTGLGEIRHG